MHGLQPVFNFLIFVLVTVSATAQTHQRLIVTAGDAAPLAFDPLTDRYRPGSLGAVAAFADEWRAELGDGNFFLADIPVRRHPLGWRVYDHLADSTLQIRAMRWCDYVPSGERDSLLHIFGLTPAAADSLAEGEWLVADRYVVDGRAAVRVKRQDYTDIRPSKRYEAEFAEDGRRVRRFFLTPMTRLDTAITTRDALFGPSGFAELFHAFHLATAKGGEISFFAPPRLDASIPVGEVCLGDILALFPFDNELVTVRATGVQVKVFMEKVFGMRFFRITGPESDLVRLKVPYYLHDDVAGLRFRVDLTARSGKRVTIYETERGEKFDATQVYVLVLNSFRAKELQEMGLKPEVVAPDYRMALAEWLARHPQLSPRARDNWSVGPERWVRVIGERERRTIFQK